jgi:hypothetical protein
MRQSNFDRLPGRIHTRIEANYAPYSYPGTFYKFILGCVLMAAFVIGICLL